MRWVTAALIGLVASPAWADDEALGKRVALLVGINVYAKPVFDNLKYAERDVEEVGKELKSLGFEVTTLTGEKATRQVIDDTALRLVGPLKKSDLMLVMLCGHGLQLDVPLPGGGTRNDAFFCPYDAVVNNPASLFSLTRLIDDILAPNVGRKLVLIDACRNDPDPARSASRGIEGKVIALPEDTAVMFSCRKGQKAFENDELRHGLFTYCVLDGLRGTAVNSRNELDWAGVVAHVALHMSSPDFCAKYLPGGGARQEPIPAGGVPYTVLGRLARIMPTPQSTTLPLPPEPRPSVPPESPAPRRSVPPESPVTRSLEGEKAGEVRTFNESLELTLVWCPAGTFKMGSSGGANVTLSQGYWLGQTEVTQGQWQGVMGTTPWATWNITNKGANYPAILVSWEEATAFCTKLTVQERQAGRLSATHSYRLPTEAEWEYACRAGTTSAYSFGDNDDVLSQYAWWGGIFGEGNAETEQYAHVVGTRHANPWQLYDMHGNVCEWCQDVYRARPAVGRDKLVTSGDSSRVLRGGGWNSSATYCRSADRNSLHPATKVDFVGFRVALSVSRMP